MTSGGSDKVILDQLLEVFTVHVHLVMKDHKSTTCEQQKNKKKRQFGALTTVHVMTKIHLIKHIS